MPTEPGVPPFELLGLVTAKTLGERPIVPPPPPGKVLAAGDLLGLVTTTLPEEPEAADFAAAVAAVERSPTTAANKAWNWPSGKGCHGLLYLQRRLLVDTHTRERSLGKACSNRRLETGPRALGNLNKLLRKRRISSRQIARRGLDRPSVGIWAGD